MPLLRYLGEGKMDLLYREIESSTGIKLKTWPRWLINEARLEERLKSGTGKGSAIVITVGNSTKAAKLCAKGLKFGGALKVVERYWEAGPSSVCMTCSGLGHDRLGSCGDKDVQCVICAGTHKAENHKCRVTGCTIGRGKICTHVVPKCANCAGNHQATILKCPARQKAQAEAWKNRAKKPQDSKRKQPESEKTPNAKSKLTEIELDTDTNWAKSPEGASSDLSLVGDNKAEDSQSSW